MLAKTGLLVVSNPKKIGTILPAIQKEVKSTLYIQLISALSEPLGGFYINVFNAWPKYSQTIFGIYTQAAKHCQHLDVRVLLSGLKYNNLSTIQTKHSIDLVIFDKHHNEGEVAAFIQGRIGSIAKNYNVITVDSGRFEECESAEDGRIYKHSVLGGTFDRLHLAHKVMLSEAVLRTSSTVTVGVTDHSMLQTKLLLELIENIETRIRNVQEFLIELDPKLSYNVVPICDPFGPAITDPTMEMIVVSEETVKGGEKINEIRQEKGLGRLDVFPIKLVDEPFPGPIDEKKISSSTARIRLLGTLLRPVDRKDLPEKPYIIGLAGGMATGKSGVAKWMSELGVLIINADKIGHEIYKSGTVCYKNVVDAFGASIVAADGEIDRRALGGIVFKNKSDLERLNSLVWPAMAEEINNIIRHTDKPVVMVEAAVLLVAGWQQFCHEVWVTVVPRDEQIKRLKVRNGISEEEANKRIDLQLSNKEYVDAANVVFCPFWDETYTKAQVIKAWDLLQGRIS